MTTLANIKDSVEQLINEINQFNDWDNIPKGISATYNAAKDLPDYIWMLAMVKETKDKNVLKSLIEDTSIPKNIREKARSRWICL